MRYAVCLLLVAALAPAMLAQDDLTGDMTVDVKPVIEGKAQAGSEYTLNLEFTVPEGYHAYHKDNPGYSKPVQVTWRELSGLELVSETWPEPYKHKDDFSEEWELSGTFQIGYNFKVPSDASGTLGVKASYVVQWCDENGCLDAKGDISADFEVTAAAEPEPVVEEIPTAKATSTFASAAKAGGKATLNWSLTVSEGYHAYHKDNPGYSKPVRFEWTNTSGLKLLETIWPEPKVHADDFSEEWELPKGGTVQFVFEVPADVQGELELAGIWKAQVCDEHGCVDREGAIAATLVVDGKVEGVVVNPPVDPNDTRPESAPAPEFSPYVTSTVPPSVEPGKEFDLKLSFTLPKGFHALTGKGFTLSVDHLSGMEPIGEAIWPSGDKFTGTFTVTYPMRALKDAGLGVAEGAFKIDYIDSHGRLNHIGRFSVSNIIGTPEVDPAAAVDEHGFYKDFDYALAKAKAEGKPLLVDFNGDY